MKLEINGKTYLVTDMFVIGGQPIAIVKMKFNVFDENYKLITSITCKDEDEFIIKFNNYLKNKTPFTI